MEGKRPSRANEDSKASKELSHNDSYRVVNHNDFTNKNIVPDSLNILYTNADCLTNKIYDLQILISTLTYKPRVIVVCEVNSKIMSNNLLESEFNIFGYNTFCVNIGIKGKRGILIYIDSILSSSIININSSFSEFLFVQIKLFENYNLTIGAIYRSPSSNSENNLALVKLINTVIKSIHGKILFIGDFNLGDIKWTNESAVGAVGANAVSKKFINCLQKNFLQQHVFSPTRVRGSQIPHILDLVITNDNFVDSIDYLSPLGKSDHCVLNVCCKLYMSNDNNIVKYKYDSGDYNGFLTYFEENFVLTNSLSGTVSVNEEWHKFKFILTSGLSLYIPSSKGQCWKHKQSWRVPINKDLKALINRKHRLWNRFNETKSDHYFMEFKKYRNLVRKQSRNVIKTVQTSIARSCKGNPKKFWQYVNSKSNCVSNIGNIKIVEDSNTKYVTDVFEKVEVFSNYFSSIYTVETNVDCIQFESVMPSNAMPQIFITEMDVGTKLNELKINKSCGPDMLHPRVLYELRCVIVGPLTNIFKNSLSSGVIPTDWTSSNVAVLFKKGKKECVENYRPISLTCICCKVMESIIRDYIASYFKSNNLFSNFQYGFIKGRSTVLQLLKVFDEWTSAIDLGDQLDVIYTDFEKAFDKVPHQRLLCKLYGYGVNHQVIDWIRGFLCFRNQSVCISGVTAKPKPVLSGIPQGSVLGPLLFVIFINDMPDTCKMYADIFLYADDAKLFRSISDINDCVKLNTAFESVHKWCEYWQMNINTVKCNVLSISRTKSNVINFDYGFNAPSTGFLKLDHVSVIKDLGVYVDNDLNFSVHIHEKISVAFKMLCIIRRSFVNLDKNTFLLLYKSLVRSHLEYANSVWCPYRINLINDLEKVQKYATKLVACCNKLKYKDRLMFLNIPTLKCRRMRGDMIEVFKIVNGAYDNQVAPHLSRNVNSRTRGHAFKLNVVRCKHDLRKFSFCNRVVNIWNSLPDFVVNSLSINSFKNNLDSMWIKEDFYYDFDSSTVHFVG